MSNPEIEKGLYELKVNELRNELEKRGLDKNGIKIALVERLELALRSQGHDPQNYNFLVHDVASSSIKIHDQQADNSDAPTGQGSNDDIVPETDLIMSQENLQPELMEELKEEPPSDAKHVEDGDGKVIAANVRVKEEKEEEEGDEEIEFMEEAAADLKKPEVEGVEEQLQKQHGNEQLKEEAPAEERKEGEGKMRSQNVDMLEQKSSASNEEAQNVQQRTATISPVVEAQEKDLASSVWIRNITNTTKAADLKALFSKHGKVLTAKIFTTKNKQSPTCFGYVTLSDPETAKTCFQNVNRLNFKGRVIYVEMADRSNLSQISKTCGTQATPAQQPQKAGESSSKAAVDAAPSLDAIEPKRNPKQAGKSSGAESKSTTTGESRKRTVRPRITAKESPTKERESSSGGGGKWRAPSSYNARVVTRPTRGVASYARPAPYAHKIATYAPVAAGTHPIRRLVQQPDGHGGVRMVVTTAGGAIPNYSAYSSRSTRIAEADSSHHRLGGSGGGHYQHHSSSSRHRSSTPNAGRDQRSSKDKEEEMLRLMRRREEEHRKKEEELRLEREREKLKYEREKLEREKLELETFKLQAQLAQATQMQFAAAVGMPAGPVPSHLQQQPQFIQQFHHQPMPVVAVQPRGGGGGRAVAKDEQRGGERKRRGTSKGEESTSRHQYHRPAAAADEQPSRSRAGNGRDNRAGSRAQAGGGTSRRSRSRSPIRRRPTDSGRTSSQQQHRSMATHSNVPPPRDSRYGRPSAPSSEDLHGQRTQKQAPVGQFFYANAAGGPVPGRSSGGGGGSSSSSSSSYVAGQQQQHSQRNERSVAADSHRHVSPAQATRSRSNFFNSSSAQDNSSNNSYNARTDPSYASRIGRPAEEMFGSGTAFGGIGPTAVQTGALGGYEQQRQQPYGREQLGAPFFNAGSGSWNTAPSNKGESSSSSRPPPFLNANLTNPWGSGGGGGQDWNVYDTVAGGGHQQQQQGGQFQQPSSSSYGRHGGGGGSNYTVGRRY